MKKADIKNLIESADGEIIIVPNKIKLARWTKNAIGWDVDCLAVKAFNFEFPVSGTYNISSRDPEGIKKEVADAVREIYQVMAEEICSRL